MSRYSAVILLIMLASILTACSSAPEQTAPEQTTPSAASPIPSAQSFDLGELSYIFDIPSDPVDVSIELDSAGTVEALIPVEGGSLTATGADGTVYTLEIPADALLSETTIGLTPVASVADMPFGGEQTYAVQMSPEGLVLQDYAILTIMPAVEIPREQQIAFGYLKAGSDLILAAPVVNSTDIQINILHFSGSGVTRGVWGDIEPVRQRLGGDAERRLDNMISEALIRARQEGKDATVNNILIDAMKQFVEQVIKPRVAAVGESCANGRLALETVNSFKRRVALLGLTEDFLAGIPTPAELLEKTARVCMLEEFEICVEDHIIWRILPAWDVFKNMFRVLGIPDGAAAREARDLTIICLTFKLEFESTVTFEAEDGGYHSSVTAEQVLRYDPDKGFILGAISELINTEFDFQSAYCPITGTPGNGVFATLGLLYEVEYGAPDAVGNFPDAGVSDLHLIYSPGNTSEIITIEACEGSAAATIGPAPLWTAAFMVTHKDELEGAGAGAIDWEILGGELFAQKEWSLVSAEDSSISEEGSFKVYHAPGQ